MFIHQCSWWNPTACTGVTGNTYTPAKCEGGDASADPYTADANGSGAQLSRARTQLHLAQTAEMQVPKLRVGDSQEIRLWYHGLTLVR